MAPSLGNAHRTFHHAWEAVLSCARGRRRTASVHRNFESQHIRKCPRATIMPVPRKTRRMVKIIYITIFYVYMWRVGGDEKASGGLPGLSQIGTVANKLAAIAICYWRYAILERSILEDIRRRPDRPGVDGLAVWTAGDSRSVRIPFNYGAFPALPGSLSRKGSRRW